MRFAKKVLLLVLLIFCVGCAGEEEQTVPVFTDVEGVDLGGYEFKYLINGAENDGILLGYTDTTAIADAVKSRIAATEKELNYVYTPVFTGDITANLMLSVSIADGSYSAMQWTSYTDSLQNVAKSGLLYPINMLSDIIDYTDSEKWGIPDILYALCWDGNLYGVFPVSWPEYNLAFSDYLFVINTDMATRLMMPDPREYVENGEWTRDKLVEITKSYTHIDGAGEKVYGLTMNSYHFAVSSLITGVEELIHRENGGYSFAAYTKEGMESLQWLSDFLNVTCRDDILTNGDDTNMPLTAFAQERAAMILTHAMYVFQTGQFSSASVAYSGIPFAILPFPVAENLDYGSWRSVFAMVKYATNIPAITDEPEAAAMILNAIYEPLEGYETQDLIWDYYERNIFHDPRDAQVVRKAIEDIQYDLRGEGSHQFFVSFATQTASKTVTQILESYEPQTTDMFDKYIVNIDKSFDEVFGK